MDIKLPNLGEGAETGVVVSLLVSEGDVISAGQAIIEVETGKAVAPIPASAAGTVARIRVKVGDKIAVGTVILTLAGEGATPAAAVAEASPAARLAKAAPGASGPAELESAAVPASPAVVDTESEEPSNLSEFAPPAAPSIRKLARELGLDLRHLRGSEPGGRIVMADLRAYIQRLQKLAAQPKTAPVAAAAPARGPAIDFSQWGPITKRPLTPLRRTIARRMTESWLTIPQVNQFDEADITGLEALRKKFAPAYEAKGVRLTLTAFALKAVAATLKKHSIFNASLDEAAGEIVLKAYYHLGLAVDTEAGLLVPVIRNVDHKSLLELSHDITRVAQLARERKLTLDDMKGGTFTISNQGGIGGAHFTPLVNPPEVAILGLGRGAWKPVVRNQQVETRLMLPLGLSYDHRLIDGGTAARFIVDLGAALGSFVEADVKV